MPYVMNKFGLFSVILSAVTSSAFGQVFIRGNIAEEKTNTGIAYANVSIWQTTGTATDENGDFLLRIEPEHSQKKIEVSCIGYYSRTLSVDSLLALNKKTIRIELKPFVTTLQEVVIQEKQMGAIEIVQEAIKAIPQNYIQQPFNMQFYSRTSVNDSTGTIFLAETIIDSYRGGYVENTYNQSQVIHKRITGTNPATAYDKKRKMEYFLYEYSSNFNLFFIDLIGAGSKINFSIFNPDYLKKVELKSQSITLFEKDTVFVIQYAQNKYNKNEDKIQLSGTLYISVKDFAILKHTRLLRNQLFEVSYKKTDGYYFPYVVTSLNPNQRNGNKTFDVATESHIVKITTNPTAVTKIQFDHTQHLEDVAYDEVFWKSRYPKK